MKAPKPEPNTPARIALAAAVKEHDALAEELRQKQEAIQRVIDAARDVGVADARAALAALETSHSAAVSRWIEGGSIGLRPEMDSKEHAKRSTKLAELVATENGYHNARARMTDDTVSMRERLAAASKRVDDARVAVLIECGDVALTVYHAAADAALAATLRVVALRTALAWSSKNSVAHGEASRRFIERTALTPNVNPGARGGLLAYAYNSNDPEINREIARLTTAWGNLEDLLLLNPCADFEAAIEPTEAEPKAD